MKALHLKLLRDVAHLRGQAAAIGLVMACGVATFVMSLSLLDSLTGTLDAYYEQNRFADAFAHMERAPLSLADRVAETPGVAHVQPRVAERVTLDMPDMIEPASGQIVSLPDDPDAGLNRLYLRAGRFPEGKRSLEVLVSQGFAHAHGLNPGDTIPAVMNGRLEHLRVVGIALSPEYIYLISPGSMFPDKARFGVFWMARDEMEAAFDMEGAFNDVLLSLTPGASEPDVLARVDELTEPYGGLGAYTRDDQVSHQFVDNEISELRGMTLIVPVIFLGVAAFLLNIVLARMIATQREQIAALKALGYSQAEIGRHYLGFVLIISGLAVVVGSAAGAWMGHGLTALYIEFFDFPSFQYTLHPRVIMLGASVSVASATIGIAHALRAAMRLPPAEAMRPQAPMSFRPTVLERLGLHRVVPVAVRMVLRQLERRPMKTAFSVLGIALAAAVLVVGSFTQDAIDYIYDFQFNRVQQYDMDVVFAGQTDEDVVASTRHLPGVLAVEPYRPVAVRIRHRQVDRRIGLIGLSRSDGLYQLMDMSGEPVTLPEHGIVLSSVLADVLGVHVGDRVCVEALEGRRPEFDVEVTGVIDDFAGLTAYIDLGEMNRLMREPGTVGGVYLTVDEAELDTVYRNLQDAPSVVAVNTKAATAQNFKETLAKNMGLMQPFLIGFAVIIAFGVVYNSARISLSERSRDLATLRVLGFTRREVSAIQLGELAIITGLAIPAGLGLGYLLAWFTATATASELVRIPFIIRTSTFVFAALIVAAASLVSGLVVRRHLDRLDMVSVLKSRE
ncbi:FtsX-like permease family protein [Phycisphaeraceae bacterium D3-23]